MWTTASAEIAMLSGVGGPCSSWVNQQHLGVRGSKMSLSINVGFCWALGTSAWNEYTDLCWVAPTYTSQFGRQRRAQFGRTTWAFRNMRACSKGSSLRNSGCSSFVGAIESLVTEPEIAEKCGYGVWKIWGWSHGVSSKADGQACQVDTLRTKFKKAPHRWERNGSRLSLEVISWLPSPGPQQSVFPMSCLLLVASTCFSNTIWRWANCVSSDTLLCGRWLRAPLNPWSDALRTNH